MAGSRIFLVTEENKMKEFSNTIKSVKITAEGVNIWTRPWANGKALITTSEEGLNQFFFHLHTQYPDHVELMVEDADFCNEDLKGAFSVVVDPVVTALEFKPGSGDFQIRFLKPPVKGEAE